MQIIASVHSDTTSLSFLGVNNEGCSWQVQVDLKGGNEEWLATWKWLLAYEQAALIELVADRPFVLTSSKIMASAEFHIQISDMFCFSTETFKCKGPAGINSKQLSAGLPKLQLTKLPTEMNLTTTVRTQFEWKFIHIG